MKQITGWYFAPQNNKLGYGDGREISIGITHKVDGKIIPCERGLHLSQRPIDAMEYASGPIIYRVKGYGTVIPHGDPIDKYACSHRKYLAGGVDVTDVLRQFARECALDVIHLRDAPEIVIQYLKTGDEKIRAAARGAARGAARAATWDAAWAAARDAARDAAWDAARDAAWAAAWTAAWTAAWAAAWDAARAAQNKRLGKLLRELL
jgi:hypothetical protein